MSQNDLEDPPRVVDDTDMPHGLRDLFAHAQDDVPPLETMELAWSSFSRARLARAHLSFSKIGIALGMLTFVVAVAVFWRLRPRQAPLPPPDPIPPATVAETTPAHIEDIHVSEPPLEVSQPLEAPSSTPRPASAHAEPEQDSPAPRRASRPTPHASESTSPPITNELSEGTLLLRARRALPADPTAALALLSEHERLAPSGVLTPEREAIAVEALARLGRHAEARRRAERFLERWPSSAHRSRVERWMNPTP